MFRLDRRDGSIYILGLLDRERNGSHEFYVKATNNPNYNSAAVRANSCICLVILSVEIDCIDLPHRMKSSQVVTQLLLMYKLSLKTKTITLLISNEKFIMLVRSCLKI